jgi:broad specificity phosphatase PhoE
VILRTTHILLLRHGQTDDNVNGVLQGHMPTPLNRLGVSQATALAARIAAYSPPIRILISSDLPRATQTAGSIASACGLRPHLDSTWRERGFGLLEGKPVGDRAVWQAASGEVDPPGAEPTAEMHDRVRAALLMVPEKYRGKTVAIVTHGGPIRAVLKMLSDGRLQSIRERRPADVPEIFNCSIFHLLARHYRSGIRWAIDTVNDCGHLEHHQ